AGFTAMLPTMAGAANRCVIPEYKFDMEHLTELLCYDRAHHPSKYSVVIVSEGAMFEGGEMVFSDKTTDAFGHLKLGGMGDLVSTELKDRSAKYNKGKPIETINQRLGYMVRGGDPDAIAAHRRCQLRVAFVSASSPDGSPRLLKMNHSFDDFLWGFCPNDRCRRILFR